MLHTGARIVVTGGAGFIGSNLVSTLLTNEFNVTVFDALLRPGSLHNVSWLSQHPNSALLRIVQEDIRNQTAVERVVADADIIFHLAGQVAVTCSIDDPRTDFEINTTGTLNVLEGSRRSGRRPGIIFTSTNKVYGGVANVPVIEKHDCYRFQRRPFGIAENQNLDFHSPYGCSKGSADQYVRDYARIFNLPSVVFRMSCIYGPRQFGTEDQGWVAHLIIAAVTGRPITIYGNGKQVRDLLFVDDLVRAFLLVADTIDQIPGEIFNIGGGPSNTMSVWGEFNEVLETLKGERVTATFADWRPGDQLCYVSDIRKAGALLGWHPQIDTKQGVRRLWDWVISNRHLFGAPAEEQEIRRFVEAVQ
jgi:CDP-paratose 2-epimerase